MRRKLVRKRVVKKPVIGKTKKKVERLEKPINWPKYDK